MTTIAAHERRREQSGMGQQPCHHGNLEHYAHGERHGHQRADIRVESDHVWHFAAHLIGAEEAEREREDEEIAYRRTQEEHQIARSDNAHRIVTLTLIKGRRDKAKQLIDHIRRGADGAHTQRRLHMDDKLLRQSSADKLDVERLHILAAERRYAVQKPISDKVSFLRSEHHVEDGHLKQERYDATHDDDGDDLYDDASQHFEMIPERHQAIHYSSFFTVSADESFSSMPFIPSLNDFTPRPRPFMSSGIFFPPKKSRTTMAMSSTSWKPMPPIKEIVFIFKVLCVTICFV